MYLVEVGILASSQLKVKLWIWLKKKIRCEMNKINLNGQKMYLGMPRVSPLGSNRTSRLLTGHNYQHHKTGVEIVGFESFISLK